MKRKQYGVIDLRFLYDGNEDEYDLGAGEVTKDNGEQKLHHDLGKLVRDGKHNLDGRLRIVMDDENAKAAFAWVIQLSGYRGEISSVHLVRDGMYVAIPQGKLAFPTDISTLDDFVDTLKVLLLFVVSDLVLCI